MSLKKNQDLIDRRGAYILIYARQKFQRIFMRVLILLYRRHITEKLRELGDRPLGSVAISTLDGLEQVQRRRTALQPFECTDRQ